MRVYLGGPIHGCTDSEAKDWRALAANTLRAMGFEPVDPLRRDYRGRALTTGTPEKIVREDLGDIDSCEACIFMCPRPSFGTAMEIFYASRAGKKTIVVVPDLDKTSPWVAAHASSVVGSLAQALDVVAFVEPEN